MAIVASTLARIKFDPLACLGGGQRVNDFFFRAGHVWRGCLLDPANTLGLFILQVLHGNTAIAHLRHLVGFDVRPSSYCEARSRLPAKALAAFVDDLCGDNRTADYSSRSWLGHSVFVADATSASAPDEPVLQGLWPQPVTQKPGLGFPAIKMLGLLDLVTGMIVQLSLMCLNVQEMSQVAGLRAALKAGDVLLADRGFCSFLNLAILAESSIFSVFRMHQRQNVDFTPNRPHRTHKGKKHNRDRPGTPTSRYVRRLGYQDQLVQWVKPALRPWWLNAEQYALMPQTLLVRELRYQIVVRGRRTRVVTIATTLVDAMRYPKREIARLYGLRWEIETNFRHLKTTMKMDQLKCHTAEGVVKELIVFVLVYNLIRAAMVLAAERQEVDPNRISFVDRLRRFCSCCRQPPAPGPINLIVNPPRPGRWQPRVLKRRMKPYDLMNRQRREYPEPPPAEELAA
jgi:hypothetical protein